MERVTDTTVDRVLWSNEFLDDQLSLDEDDAMRRYRAVFARPTAVAWPKRQSYNVVRGIATVTVEDWAKANI